MDKIRTKAGKNKYQWDYQEFRYLVDILSGAKDFKDILNLFIDLHTPQEVSEIIRRVIIVSMIVEGLTYEEIIEATGASAGTISRLQSKLHRQKSVLEDIIVKRGSYGKFTERVEDEKDNQGSMIDNIIAKHSLGIFGKKLHKKAYKK